MSSAYRQSSGGIAKIAADTPYGVFVKSFENFIGYVKPAEAVKKKAGSI